MIKYQAKVPFKLTKLFIDTLGEKPVGKNVIVIRDVFTAMYLAIDNSVTFVTDDIEAKRVFERNVLANGEFGNDDNVSYIDIADIDMKTAWLTGIEKVTKNMNFDIIIGNPPYNEAKPEGLRRTAPRLDTPIWKIACKHAKNVVFVMGTCNSRKNIGQTYQSEEFGFPGDVCISVNIFAYQFGKPVVQVKSRLEENGFNIWLKEHRVEHSIRELLLPALKDKTPRFYLENPVVPENEIWMHTRSGSKIYKNIFTPGMNYRHHTVQRLSCPSDKVEQLKQYIIDTLTPICEYGCKKFNVDAGCFLCCVPLPDFMM